MVTTGHKRNIETIMQFEKNTEHPRTRNKTIVDYILKTNQSYSQIKCLEYCFDLNYIQDKPCNCTKSELGHVWMDCWIEQENKTIDSCTFKYKSKFYKNNLANVCAEYCPLECDSIEYDLTVLF